MVRRVEHHAFARAQTEHRGGDISHRCSLPRPDVEAPGQLRVAHRRRLSSGRQGEGHRQHHKTAWLAFEPAVPIGEIAVRRS